MQIESYLKQMISTEASDLFLTVGRAPLMKIHGEMHALDHEPLTPDHVRAWLFELMDETQKSEFLTQKELNFAVSASGIGRFRASAFFQRNVCGAVLRRIKTEIPTLEQLALPQALGDLSLLKRGLVLLVGGTGVGKSTSLAAMINHRNQNTHGHILMVEDPIEYLHQHQGCIVTQREVGIDTESFETALKNGLRQAPDVIVVGEIRSRETMQQAINFAETGHLCLATLHANNANQALDRIVHFFPTEQHPQIWMDLSFNLKGIVAQRLVPVQNQQTSIAVHEIMLNTPVMSELIRKGDVHKLKPLMARQNESGMQTFDQALFALYQQQRIGYDEALACADSANDLRLMIKLGSSHVDEPVDNAMARPAFRLQD